MSFVVVSGVAGSFIYNLFVFASVDCYFTLLKLLTISDYSTLPNVQICHDHWLHLGSDLSRDSVIDCLYFDVYWCITVL